MVQGQLKLPWAPHGHTSPGTYIGRDMIHVFRHACILKHAVEVKEGLEDWIVRELTIRELTIRELTIRELGEKDWVLQDREEGGVVVQA